jgi:hypothetical protein
LFEKKVYLAPAYGGRKSTVVQHLFKAKNITPALMMGMGDIILDRISFGGIKELEEIYFD